MTADELFFGIRSESIELIEELEAMALDAEREISRGEQGTTVIFRREAFRILHTLKGNAGFYLSEGARRS